MSIVRVYVPDLAPGIARLSREESHHAVHVLRLRHGNAVVAFDGAGKEGLGRVSAVDRGLVGIEVAEVATLGFDVPVRMTLAVAMGKVHRQGYLIEKCTELGVAAIWPMFAERSVAKPRDAATEKRRRRAIEAAKQSGRAWIPQIRSPMLFGDVLKEGSSFEVALIADTDNTLRRLSQFISTAPCDCNALVLVGPEGGWTDAERAQAADAGFAPTSLSATILRTETAAVAVCAAAAILPASR